MTLEEIHWISELFETRKMSKAAQRLFVSQPALSQCLQRVEQQLGFKLFERSNKGLEPTQKGLLFYDMSLQIRNTYDQFLARISLLDQRMLRSITIGMPLYLSARAATEILLQLKAAFPDVSFSVYESNTSGLVEAMCSNKLQLVIANDPVVPGDVVVHPLIWLPTAIFLRSGSPLQDQVYEKNGRKYLDPRLLKDEPITVTKHGQASRMLADNVFAECGLEPHILHETSHVFTLFRNAQAGISSSIGSCTIEAHNHDIDRSVICFVPETYKWSHSKVATYALPEVDKLLPQEIYPILRRIVSQCGVYYTGDV